MNKKTVLLLIGLLAKSLTIHSMQSENVIFEYPTEEEVFAKPNALAVNLYTLHIEYLLEPLIPQGETFEERLDKHTLVQDPWFSEKGFIAELKNHHHAGSALEIVKEVIEKNPAYQKLVEYNLPAAQKMVKANLLHAYKDCK